MIICSKCGTPMELDQTSETYFWRCKAFPSCENREIIDDIATVYFEAIKKKATNSSSTNDSQGLEEKLQSGDEE